MIQIAMTPEKLETRCETLVNHDSMRYSEALLAVAEELDIEPEDLVPLIPRTLKSKIEFESRRNGGLKGRLTSQDLSCFLT